MLHKAPFVLYLNLTVCLVLFLMVLPIVLNRLEALKVRVAFFLIFFTVIITCLINLLILYWSNYRLVPLGFFAFSFPLMFGPFIYFYVKSLLNSPVKKNILLSLLVPFISVSYGIYIWLQNTAEQQEVFRRMIYDEGSFYQVLNLFTLIITLVYCVKAWAFLTSAQLQKSTEESLYMRLKKAWAKEFILYIAGNVLVFLILVIVLTKFLDVPSVDMDLIGMPVFMLFVYLLISVRSMMMYKEFEVQYVLNYAESVKRIQEQRLEISRDVHDNIGSQLTFIRSILDNLKSSPQFEDDALAPQLKELSDCCNDSITELRNTLWVLNSDEIHLEDLQHKMMNFIDKARAIKKTIRFATSFSFEENRIISSKQAVNIFRIFQEIINNALKHSGATAVSVKLTQNAGLLSLHVSDNGCGFDSEIGYKGYGLKNMVARVTAINGKLKLKSKVNGGTRYDIDFIG
ncbi:hypothetical protein BCY91_02625 [Pelobium manganitolerans]|uniref:Histidine kinase domain-containing protein n=1 Tax=Pelobium manganitolerans TaxID=1842495 RepID=A0A419S6X4_9SPHI|nr:hypothetical protein BCY91_02625 [Pelobium manganitolerans]